MLKRFSFLFAVGAVFAVASSADAAPQDLGPIRVGAHYYHSHHYNSSGNLVGYRFTQTGRNLQIVWNQNGSQASRTVVPEGVNPTSLATACPTIIQNTPDTRVLYKTNAAGMQPTDSRFNKPLFLHYQNTSITPNRFGKLNIRKSNGSVIAAFGAYPFGQPLIRWYSGAAGGNGFSKSTLRAKALQNGGNGFIYIPGRNGLCWKANPLFRTFGK